MHKFSIVVKKAATSVFIILALFSCSPENPFLPPAGPGGSGGTDKPAPPVVSQDEWTDFEHEGFTFKVRTYLCGTATALQAIAKMKADLSHINKIIPEDILTVMKKNPIWLEKDLNTGAAWYHISKEWLQQEGYMVEKAKCVEISNYENYVSWSNQNQPLMVFHELTHLFHDQGVTNGLDNADILAAYNNAKNKGMYKSTDSDWLGYRSNTNDTSDKWTRPAESYALGNHHEFFTETSEAYWGENDYYPFNYEQLKEYDPVMFDVLVKIWGERPDKVKAE